MIGKGVGGVRGGEYDEGREEEDNKMNAERERC